MTHRSIRVDLIATLCCVGFLSCWTVGSLQIEYLSRQVDVWTQNFLRYMVACLFWLPFLLYTIRRGRMPVGLWGRALAPLAANMVMQVFWAWSFYYAEPGFVMLLNKTSSIWVASFSIFYFVQERALLKSPFFWVGLMCSITGVVGVIMFQRDASFQTSFWGVFLALGSSVSWAIYSICAKIAFKGADSRVSFAVITIYMTIGLGVLAFLLGSPTECLKMDAVGWLNLLTSAVIAIALAHVLYYVAIQRIGATIPAMTLLASPFMTIVASRFIFQERLTLLQLIFGTVLIAGAAAAILAQKDIASGTSANRQ